MGWSLGFDSNWSRDIGYGVPAWCDAACGTKIDRGLAYVCGGGPYGEPDGCGLYFCDRHLYFTEEWKEQMCSRCIHGDEPYEPTADHPEWVKWKLEDESWEQWRNENPAAVAAMAERIVHDTGGMV